MQVQCPNCGEIIRAEHINIHEKISVCSACNTVFKFEIAEEKAKRRKIKQPSNLKLSHSDEKLQMRFRTNFRLDKDTGFVSSSILAGFSTFISGVLFGRTFAGQLAPILPEAFAVLAVFFFYLMALVVFNHTEIEMDADSILVSRKPLPSQTNQAKQFKLSGLTRIYAEETAISIKEAFDTPRFNVWAEMPDGSRKVVVHNLIEDYAFFVAQTLNERLQSSTGFDGSRLEDSADDGEEQTDLGALLTKDQSLSNR